MAANLGRRKNRRRRAVCRICGEPFAALTRRHCTCSAECQRERKRRASAAWYAENRDAHIARVLGRRKESG